jgi:hypothetical protein
MLFPLMLLSVVKNFSLILKSTGHFKYCKGKGKKGKATPLQAWTGP